MTTSRKLLNNRGFFYIDNIKHYWVADFPRIITRIHLTSLTLTIITCTFLSNSILAFSAPKTLTFSAIENSNKTPIIYTKLQKVYSQLGIFINIRPMPAARAEAFSDSHNIDGELFRVEQFAESHPNLIMVKAPIGSLKGVALSIKEEITISSLNDFYHYVSQGYRVGVRRGVVFSHQLTRDFSPTIVNSNAQLINMLKRGRIDIAIMSKDNSIMFIKQLIEEKIKINSAILVSYNLYHFINKKHAAIEPKLTELLTPEISQ